MRCRLRLLAVVCGYVDLVMVVIPEKKQALQIEGGVCRSHVIIRKKGTDRLGLGLYAGAESARDYRFKQGSKQSRFSR